MDITDVLLFLVLAVLLVAGGVGLGYWTRSRAQTTPRVDAGTSANVAADALIAPVAAALSRVEQQLAATERHRAEAHGQLQEQVRSMNESSQLLRSEAASLVQALRAPQTRGRWGEVQLRRVVELAGLVEHCDFTEQLSVGRTDNRQRPDLVVHLAGGKNIVVDAKVSLAAYLEASGSTDPVNVADRRAAHARHFRTHIDQLAGREYWEALSPSPEFVVLFVPAEPFLSAALDDDPTLLEHAFARQVVIATPNTLVALLRTVAYTWRQDALAENAQEVLAAGRELHQRLGVLGGHLAKMGSSLESSVRAYNQAIGSLESRVLVTARRFHELKVVDEPASAPPTIDLAPRLPQAAELIDEDGGLLSAPDLGDTAPGQATG
jgi:DNA recombination protein RmuC